MFVGHTEWSPFLPVIYLPCSCWQSTNCMSVGD